MLKLALGAGHGFNSAGKRCLKTLDPNETREWWLNDRICDKLEQKLAAYDDVEILRVDDSDDGADNIALTSRVRRANEWAADLYLSIHHNAGINGGTGGGIVAYCYTTASNASFIWRDELYERLVESTVLRGNRAIGKAVGNHYVTRYTKMPAVLLELGFMDSKTDVPIILTEEYAYNCAAAITKVIAAQAGLNEKRNCCTVVVGGISGKSTAEDLAAEMVLRGYTVTLESNPCGGTSDNHFSQTPSI